MGPCQCYSAAFWILTTSPQVRRDTGFSSCIPIIPTYSLSHIVIILEWVKKLKSLSTSIPFFGAIFYSYPIEQGARRRCVVKTVKLEAGKLRRVLSRYFLLSRFLYSPSTNQSIRFHVLSNLRSLQTVYHVNQVKQHLALGL